MKLNIILDSRSLGRYEAIMDQIEIQGINEFEIFPCIIKPKIIESINASHKMIVKMAKDKGEEMVCIGEDDLFFPAKDGWKFYLDNMPKQFDLYLGATYITPISNGKICGFHLYTVHNKFYDRFLDVPDTEHIDTAMNSIQGDYKFCYPFPALQRPGFSANNRCEVNYNAVLKSEDIYVGK